MEALEALLLDQAIDAINASQKEGCSVLQCAASAGHHELLIKLLQRDYTALTPAAQEAAIGGLVAAFVAAARQGHMQCLHALLHAAGPARLAHASDANGFTLLQRCAEAGRVECVRLLLSADSPERQVAATGPRGVTALMQSAWHGHVACMRELLSRSPTHQVEAVSATGFTALMYCVAKGCHEGVALLLHHSPEAQVAAAMAAQRQTPLMHAAARGNAACVALLLAHMPEVQVAAVTAAPSNGANGRGYARSHGVGHRPHATAPALPAPCGPTADEDPALPPEDARPDSPMPALPSGWNALMFACDRGHAEVAALLLRHSPAVQVAAADSNGRYAAMLAARGGHVACLKLCLAHAAAEGVGAYGHDLLLCAAEGGSEDCMQLTLAHIPAPSAALLTDALRAAAAAAATATAPPPAPVVHARCLQLLVSRGARLPHKADADEADVVWRAMQELAAQAMAMLDALETGAADVSAGEAEERKAAVEEMDVGDGKAEVGGGAANRKRTATEDAGRE